MKIKALLVIPIALLLFSNGAQAQGWFWGMSYGMAVPTADTKDFTEGTSWRNFGIDILYEVGPNTAVGAYFGWNVFDEITAEVALRDNVDVFGTQFRYVNAFPMLATIRQFFGDSGSIRPFVGAGVGAQYNKNRVDIGQWRIEDNTWHLAAAPEVGVVLPLGNASWFFNAKYNYAFKASDRTQSHFALNIGVAWQTGGF
jgi:outer membrane protein